jgi:hypothetical protein
MRLSDANVDHSLHPTLVVNVDYSQPYLAKRVNGNTTGSNSHCAIRPT